MNASSKAVAVCSFVLTATALQFGCAPTPKTLDSAPVIQTTQQPRPQVLTGKVVETMNSSGYTYINLEKDGKTAWVAIPQVTVKVGQELKVWSGMEMGSFTSPTLNRTFDNIVFSPGIATDSTAPKAGAPASAGSQSSLPPGHPTLDQQARLPQGHPQVPAQSQANSSTISGKVVETMNSGGYTYVNMEKDGKKTWVALPVMQVSIGQELVLVNGTEMKNFSSKSLNKTFDSIIFSSGPAEKK